jgi:predicted NBD/HSP70 family sugar kinase
MAMNEKHGRSPHEALILRLLRDEPEHSRTTLSEATGFSPTTITKIVTPLISRGLLTEREAGIRGVGRPALTLVPIPDAVTVVGVQLGVGTIKVGLTDARANVRSAQLRSFDPAAPVEEVIELIASTVSSVLEADDGAPCLGVGIGVPAPVDEAHRRIVLSINLGWKQVPIADLLEARLDLPVVVDHNVRSMALAEARYGAHEVNSIAYVYVKTGLGFGVAVKGQPFYGGSGGESYLGHTRVVEHGELCSCGARGCLETMVSEPYILRRLAAIDPSFDPAAETNPLGILHEWASRGEPAAVELEDSIIGHMGNAVATVVNLFTPGLLLLGGIFATAPAPIVSAIRERTREQIFPLLRETLRVEPADGSLESAVSAGASVALEELMYR